MFNFVNYTLYIHFSECLLWARCYVETRYMLVTKTDKSLTAQWQRQTNMQINAKLSTMRSEMKALLSLL